MDSILSKFKELGVSDEALEKIKEEIAKSDRTINENDVIVRSEMIEEVEQVEQVEKTEYFVEQEVVDLIVDRVSEKYEEKIARLESQVSELESQVGELDEQLEVISRGIDEQVEEVVERLPASKINKNEVVVRLSQNKAINNETGEQNSDIDIAELRKRKMERFNISKQNKLFGGI